MQYTEIAAEINVNAAALNFEVATLAQVFSENNYFGDHHGQFRHAHFGYLMSCMAQFDLMSKCWNGEGEPVGGTRLQGSSSATSMLPRLLSIASRSSCSGIR